MPIGIAVDVMDKSHLQSGIMDTRVMNGIGRAALIAIMCVALAVCSGPEDPSEKAGAETAPPAAEVENAESLAPRTGSWSQTVDRQIQLVLDLSADRVSLVTYVEDDPVERCTGEPSWNDTLFRVTLRCNNAGRVYVDRATFHWTGSAWRDDLDNVYSEPHLESYEKRQAAVREERQGLVRPTWYRIDEEENRVTLDLTTGLTQANNYWNFNGFHGGTGEIVVPQGYEVTLNFENADPNMPHSLAVHHRTSNSIFLGASNFPGDFPQDFQPTFQGAITRGATQMQTATQPGESETITFIVDQAGSYSLVCLIPGHALVGMWVKFTVADSPQYAGVHGVG